MNQRQPSIYALNNYAADIVRKVEDTQRRRSLLYGESTDLRSAAEWELRRYAETLPGKKDLLYVSQRVARMLSLSSTTAVSMAIRAFNNSNHKDQS